MEMIICFFVLVFGIPFVSALTDFLFGTRLNEWMYFKGTRKDWEDGKPENKLEKERTEYETLECGTYNRGKVTEYVKKILSSGRRATPSMKVIKDFAATLPNHLRDKLLVIAEWEVHANLWRYRRLGIIPLFFEAFFLNDYKMN